MYEKLRASDISFMCATLLLNCVFFILTINFELVWFECTCVCALSRTKIYHTSRYRLQYVAVRYSRRTLKMELNSLYPFNRSGYHLLWLTIAAYKYTLPLFVWIIKLHFYTVSGKKSCHFIFDYNSRISWSIFAIFSPVETGMNTPQSRVIYLLNSLMTS